MLIMAVGLTSCSDVYVPEEELASEALQSEFSQNQASDDPVLNFKNQEEFQMVVNKIASFKTDEEKLNWVKENYPDFSSIQSI